ncbi:MAG: LPS-assembly protein LptD [Candidatus Tectomicrobia bacterium]|uniref:LPS-assembly protein LptD n=1 Tax=Tectimicrobiota bacterium TaxID=2528274 RepID=A0A932FXX2_UNCTE|nr:LPS-assembly protein LptD [Candidatus Tectomicrobia bacterium]
MRKFHLMGWLLPLAFLLFLAPQRAQGAPEQGETLASSPITILADHLEQRQDQSLVIGQGFVDVRFGDFRVQADQVQINTRTGEGFASGNVEIQDQDSHLYCDRIEFNIFTKRGVMYQVKGNVASTYYVTGERLERLTDEQYKIKGGTLSSCQGDVPSWSFKTQEVVVKLDRYALLKGPSLWVKKIPALYLPLLMVPLSDSLSSRKRSTGLLTPSFSFSDRDGLVTKNSLFWAINDHSDATVSLDYLMKRGLRPDVEYRYAWSKDTHGKLRSSFLHDNDKGGNFFKLEFDHQQKFQNGIEGMAKVDLVSTRNGNKEFEDNVDERTRRYSDTFLNLRKNWENQGVQFYAEYLEGLRSGRRRESSREEVLRKLPEISYAYQATNIPGTPFFFQAESSAVDLYREPRNFRGAQGSGGVNSLIPEKEELVRMDFFPQISMPIRGLPWMTLVPKLGFRETFFSQLEGYAKDSFSRELLVFESRLEGPKSYRTFALNGERFSSIKHLIEPRVTYKYAKTLGSDRSEASDRHMLPFDLIDAYGPQHSLGFSLINRFLAKEKKGDHFASREIARLELSQITHLNRDGVGVDNRKPFSSLNVDLETSIFPFLEFNMDASVNLNEGAMSRNSQQIKAKWPKIGYFTLDRRYFKLSEEDRRFFKKNNKFFRPALLDTFLDNETEEFYRIGLGLEFIRNLNLEFGTRFDASRGKAIENDFGFRYTGSCFELGFGIYHRRDKMEFSFLVSLQGLGTIGKIGKERAFHRP